MAEFMINGLTLNQLFYEEAVLGILDGVSCD